MFDIDEHPDGWSPKSEAGARFIPIHSKLLREYRLVDFVLRMGQSQHTHIFHDLTPGGPDAKLSCYFSRHFSKHKTAAGVGRQTVFHSFRHSVSTILRNTDAAIREDWIDAILGHEGTQKSQGSTTYLKRIGAKNLVRTVEAIAYPPCVDIGALFAAWPAARADAA